jgi:hypothetical protein
MSELVATIKPDHPGLVQYPHWKLVKYDDGYTVGYGVHEGGDSIPMATERELLPDLAELHGYEASGAEWAQYQADPDEWRKTRRDEYLKTHGNNYQELDYKSVDPLIDDQLKSLSSRVGILETQLAQAHEVRHTAEEERDAEHRRAEELEAELERVRNQPPQVIEKNRKKSLAGAFIGGAALAAVTTLIAASHVEWDSDLGWQHKVEKQASKISHLEKRNNDLHKTNKKLVQEDGKLKLKVSDLQTSNNQLQAQDKQLEAENQNLESQNQTLKDEVSRNGSHTDLFNDSQGHRLTGVELPIELKLVGGPGANWLAVLKPLLADNN